MASVDTYDYKTAQSNDDSIISNITNPELRDQVRDFLKGNNNNSQDPLSQDPLSQMTDDSEWKSIGSNYFDVKPQESKELINLLNSYFEFFKDEVNTYFPLIKSKISGSFSSTIEFFKSFFTIKNKVELLKNKVETTRSIISQNQQNRTSQENQIKIEEKNNALGLSFNTIDDLNAICLELYKLERFTPEQTVLDLLKDILDSSKFSI